LVLALITPPDLRKFESGEIDTSNDLLS